MKLIHLSIAVGLGMFCQPAQASDEHIVAVPDQWRLQNYVNEHKVHLWYTGAPGCINGGIHTTGMNESDQDRLWSLILTAKSVRKKVGIYYSSDAGTCIIQSFYIEE